MAVQNGKSRWKLRLAAVGTVLALRGSGVDALTPASWLSAVSGTWTDASKWSIDPLFPNDGTPPASTYAVTISATGSPYTITNLSDITIQSLSVTSADAVLSLNAGTFAVGLGAEFKAGTVKLAGGQIGGAGAFDFTGATAPATLDWQSGTLGTSGSTTFGANATLNTGTLSSTRMLSRVLNNDGTMNFAASINFNSGTINNRAGGVMNFTASSVFANGSGTNAVTNNGTINMIGGTPFSPIRLSRPGSGTFTNNGTIAVSTGGWMQFDIGTFNHSANSIVTGNGVADFGFGTHQINGSVTFAAAMLMSSGTITGAGDIGFTKSLSWSGGTISGSGQMNLLSGAVLDTGTLSSTRMLSRVLNNDGTMNLAASINFNSGTINNRSGGVMNLTASSVFASGSGTNAVTNNGTINMIGGTPFSPIRLSRPGSGTFTNNGTIAVSTGGWMQFDVGTFNHSANSVVTGNGVVDLGFGTHFINGSTTFAGGMLLSSGTITGAGDIGFTKSLSWSGGTISGSGQMNLLSGAVLDTGTLSSTRMLSRVLNNDGTMNLAASINFNSGTINNRAGGVMNLTASSVFANGSGTNAVTNNGTINMIGGTPFSPIRLSRPGSGTFTNNGTIAVSTGGWMQFDVGTFNHSANSVVTGNGVVDLGFGTHFINGPSTFAAGMLLNGGTIAGDSELQLTKSFSWNSGTLLGSGTTSIPSGTITLASGAVLDTGTFSSTRTLSRFLNNDGTMNLAASINFNGGTLTNRAGGVINFNASSVLNFGTGSNSVINNGTFNFDASNTTLLYSVPQGTNSNNGTFNVIGGTMQYSFGTFGHGTNSVVRGSGIVDLGYSTHLINGTTTFSANKTLLNGGTISGAGTLHLGSNFTWSSGTMSGTGATVISPATTLNTGTFSGTRTLSRLLINDGTASITGTITLNGGTLLNRAGVINIGTLTDFQSGAMLHVSGGSVNVGNLRANNPSSPVITLAGGTLSVGSMAVSTSSLNWTAGTLNLTNSDFIVNSSGALGQNVTISGNQRLAISRRLIVPSGGSLSVVGGATINAAAVSLISGTTQIGDGTSNAALVVGPGGLTFSGTLSPVLTIVSGATPGRVVLNGDVSSILTVGSASIVSSVGGANPGILDLGGVTRSFNIDNGSSTIDMSIASAITNGGINKRGLGWLQISGPIQTTGGVTVNSGTLEILGSQNFTAAVTLQGGVLRVTSDQSLGNAGNAILFQGGALQLDGSFTSTRSLSVNGNGALFVGDGQTVEQAASITGNGTFNKTGGGTLALTSSNSFSGVFGVSGGTVALTGGGSLGSVSGAQMGPLSAFVIDNSSNGNANRLNDSADVILDGGTFSLIGPAGAATTETVGVLIPRSGGSTVIAAAGAGGTATLNFSAGLGTRGSGAMVNFIPANSASKIILAGQANGFIGGWATVNGVDFAKYNANGVVAFDPGDYTTSLTSNTHVKLSSSASTGTISLTSLNIDASAGNVDLTLNSATDALVLSSGGLLKYGANSSTISGGKIQTGGSELFVYVNDGPLTISSQLEETAAGTVLAKSGAGTLILGSGAGDTIANTFTGTTYVHAGVMDLNKAAGTNAIAGSLTIDGGTVRLLQADQITDTSTVIVQGGTLNLNGQNETIFNLRNFGGTIITGAGSLTVISPSTMTLAGGTTTVNSGRTIDTAGLLVSGGNNVLQENSVVNVGVGGFTMTNTEGPNPTLVIERGSGTPAKLVLGTGANLNFTGTSGTGNIGGNTLAGQLDLAAGSRTFTVNNGTADVDLVITASIVNGGFTKSGAGRLQLRGTNSYTLGTIVSNGTLELAGATLGTGSVVLNGGNLALKNDAATTLFSNSLTTGSATLEFGRVTPGATGFLRMQNLSIGANRLTIIGDGGGTFAFATSQLTGSPIFDVRGTSLAVGPISGSFGLTKEGSGTLSLTAVTIGNSNSYTGATIVNAGTIEVSKPSAISIPGALVINGPGAVRATTNNQFLSTSDVTLNSALAPALLEFVNTTANIRSLSFVGGGVVSTGSGTLTIAGDVQASGATGGAVVTGNVMLSGIRTFNVADTTAEVDLDLVASIGGPGLIKIGAGSLRVRGRNNLSGPLTLSGGALFFDLDPNLAAAAGTGSTTVNTTNGGTWAITNGSSLRLASNVTNNGTISVDASSLFRVDGNLTSTGSITIRNGAIVDYPNATPVDVIRSKIQTAFAGGAWTGPGIGIGAPPASNVALGYAESGEVGISTFLGEQIDATAILLRYTIRGDTNLDRVVNALDFNALATHFGAGSALNWGNGDFNYDGLVNTADFTVLATNFNQSLASSAPLGALVPEPSTAMALLSGLFLSRRSKSRRCLIRH